MVAFELTLTDVNHPENAFLIGESARVLGAKNRPFVG
jgi:hypothetical protein